MIHLHHDGARMSFENGDAIIDHFSLTSLPKRDLAGLIAASEANWPLHAAIDPCHEEISGQRVLLLEASAEELADVVRMRREDI